MNGNNRKNGLTPGLSVRYVEIDFIRGLSISAMIIYHGIWNLWYFQLVSWDLTSSLSLSIARAIGSSFLIVLGVCLYLSFCMAKETLNGWELSRKFLTRGSIIFTWAMGITVITHYLVDGEIFFGVLHLIGLSVMLSPIFLMNPIMSGLIGMALIAIGHWASTYTSTFFLGIPLGIGKINYYMLDYYPLIPWLGVVLAGISLGHFFYPGGRRKYPNLNFDFLYLIPGMQGLLILSRRPLTVYLAHQPILFSITYLAAEILIPHVF